MSACASLPEQWKLLLNGKPIADRKAALTPEMAIKLSVVIGSSPQMWLNLQNAWSLAEAEKTVDVSRLRRLVTQ